MIILEQPTPSEREAAMAYFAQACLVDELIFELETSPLENRRPAPSELLADLLAAYRDQEARVRIDSFTATSDAGAGVQHYLLMETASVHLPQAMAASTGDLADRDADGFHLSFTRSQAEPNQVYVLIACDQPDQDMPRQMVICDQTGLKVRLELPDGEGEVIQFILETESEAYRYLADPRSEVYLM